MSEGGDGQVTNFWLTVMAQWIAKRLGWEIFPYMKQYACVQLECAIRKHVRTDFLCETASLIKGLTFQSIVVWILWPTCPPTLQKKLWKFVRERCPKSMSGERYCLCYPTGYSMFGLRISLLIFSRTLTWKEIQKNAMTFFLQLSRYTFRWRKPKRFLWWVKQFKEICFHSSRR